MPRRRFHRFTLVAASVLAIGIGCANSESLDPEISVRAPDAGGPISGAGGTVGSAGSPGPGIAGSGGGPDTTGMAGTSGPAGSTGSGGTQSTITSGQAGSNSDGADAGAGGNGGGIVSGQAGSIGPAGTNGNAGRGGSFGAGGRGGATGFAGRGGSFGAGGRGGAVGTAGSAGSADAGTNPDGAGAPTFTDIYTNILLVYCAGSSCHNPGSQAGVSFASQSSAYSAIRSRVTPGNGAGSRFFNTVNSGSMPRGAPKLSAANLDKIKAWIDGGAVNN